MDSFGEGEAMKVTIILHYADGPRTAECGTLEQASQVIRDELGHEPTGVLTIAEQWGAKTIHLPGSTLKLGEGVHNEHQHLCADDPSGHPHIRRQ